ncbi:MAG: 50S ribosomal protein L25 [Verrucomicrobiales bacterium]|jgi:large subunit ribosomal protein L25|nr:50S ribosomal protein L25 [Verrucomicrobiales bacterium]
MAKRIAIKAESRSGTGRIQAKKSRAAGKIPGVLYGLGEANPIHLSAVEIVAAINATGGESTLVDLEIDATKHLALISEFQVHPVKDKLLHVDFHEVDPNKKMHAEVAVHETGEAVGVKDGGGVLDHILRHLRVECLPADLPSHFTVDVSALALGQAIHVKEVPLPKGVTILNDPELTVFAVHAPKVEVESTAAAEGATPAEPEVITAKKDKEEGAAPAEAKAEKK